MEISRRELFRWITASAAGLTLSQAMEGMAAALTADDARPVLVWYGEGGEDAGMMTLLGQSLPGFLEQVTVEWNVAHHDGLSAVGAKLALGPSATAPVLVLEQLPPREVWQAEGGHPLAEMLPLAKAAILLGSTACYGGWGTPPAEVAHFQALCDVTNTPVIKLPGMPAPPHHLVGTLAHMEYFGFPKLDSYSRPTLYYGQSVCEDCERRVSLERGDYAGDFAEDGCLLKLGCKGLIARNSCSTVRWNDGENWCVGAGAPCVACSEPGFPDHGGIGLHGNLMGRPWMPRSELWGQMDRLGWGLLGLVGTGIGLHALRRLFFPRPTDIPFTLRHTAPQAAAVAAEPTPSPAALRKAAHTVPPSARADQTPNAGGQDGAD